METSIHHNHLCYQQGKLLEQPVREHYSGIIIVLTAICTLWCCIAKCTWTKNFSYPQRCPDYKLTDSLQFLSSYPLDHFFFFFSLCTSIPPIQLNHQRLESTEMVQTLNYPPWGSVSAGRLSAWPACWLHCKSNKTDRAPKNNHTKKHEVLASKLINATKANLPNRYPVIKVLEGFSGCRFFKLRNESAFPEWVNSISY